MMAILTEQEIFEGLPQLRDMLLESPDALLPHSIIIPYATYSPWLADMSFLTTFAAVGEYSLVDIYRCYELWKLVEQVATLPGDLLEVGTWRGGSGALMAAQAKAKRMAKTVFLCDTFQGVVNAGAQDSVYQGGEHADTSIAMVSQLMDRLQLDNTRILAGIFPDQTGDVIADLRFALCHIDVDVYQSARDSFNWVWSRLEPGGVVVFDDYGFANCDGVTKLVNDYHDYPGALLVHNLNGHALMIKTSDRW